MPASLVFIVYVHPVLKSNDVWELVSNFETRMVRTNSNVFVFVCVCEGGKGVWCVALYVCCTCTCVVEYCSTKPKGSTARAHHSKRYHLGSSIGNIAE